jgi:GT2 family glycosyltransferase
VLAARAVDVVILSWNDGPLLRAAVDSVLAQRGIEPHVIVVDNGSDAAPDLPEHPAITLVRNEENRGVAAARNQGIALGRAADVLILDSDAELGPGCLAALIEALDADPVIGLAAPVYEDQPPEASAGRAPTVARKLARGLGLTSNYRGVRRAPDARRWPVAFAIGACQLLRRAAWDRVGGIDETFFYGPEDLDFCLRLGQAGFTVVQVADAHCHHPARRRHRSLFAPGGARHARALARHYGRRWAR